jgi:stage III sporulation protein AF
VLATFLQLILPPGGMRRYANLALGLVVVLTLLSPILSLTKTSWDMNELLGQAQAQTAWSELKYSSELLQKQNDASLLQTYRELLGTQIRDAVERVDEVELLGCHIELVEDQAADDFGRVISIKVECKGANAIQSVYHVEPVKIGEDAAQEKELPPPNDWAIAKQKEIQQALAKLFLITEEQIAVTIIA